ncbi:MAG: SH3 domain-containing protein [Deltaproteobacteria bacterium]|nr:SH3 domain-containing protein [Deltaproteobacteria bacterium]
MSIARKLMLVFVLLLSLSAIPAIAAQEAVVTVEQAAIRERPSLDAKIIESKPVGAKLRVSSFGKDGWYKTKTSIGQFGWIWQGDLTLTNFSDDIKASNLEMPERTHERRSGVHLPWLFFRFSLGLSSLVAQIGDTKGHLHLSPLGFLEISARAWRPDLRAAVRAFSFSNGYGVAFGDNDTDVLPGATGVMIGLENDISESETHDFSVGLYAGINTITNVQIVQSVGPVGAPSTTTTRTVNLQGYPVLLNCVYKYYFQRWLSLVGEIGFLYDYIPQSDIPNFGSSHVSQFGPSLTMGLQLGI